MKVLKFIGAVLYSLISAYIIWLVFFLLTPWLMNFGWIAVILYIIIAGGLISTMLKLFAAAVTDPLFYLIDSSNLARIFAIVVFALVGLYTLIIPWTLLGTYSFLSICIGISLTLTAFSIFTAILMTLYRPLKK